MERPLHVLKFGGTSVGSVERIADVAKRVASVKDSGIQVVVVVSAMAGETNRLMALAKQIDKVPNERELDVLLSAGEQVSMALLAMTLNSMGYSAVSLTGGQAKITTDNLHNDATIRHIDTLYIEQLLQDEKIVIVAGFQGVNENGDITTLGRGGSDTSAVALAGALKADECQIFTDVDGVYTCDPRVVSTAKKLDVIDFPNMEEMASKGAKVLHLPCVQSAWNNQVPLRVRSSFSADQGTLVCGTEAQAGICGIAIQKDLIFIGTEPEETESLLKQCQLLSIPVWTVIEQTDRNGVVVKEDAYDRLTLVFAEKIRNSEKVSSLTAVGFIQSGGQIQGIVEHSCELLASEEIDVFASFSGNKYSMLLLKPELVEKAANIIHNRFIVSEEVLEQQQKLAVS
ncbi:aspartate kinase [Vibrio sp. HA2012]|uniref:aspartate kinase n=1 Tax=Vibrio sp. HA2012 TaxID=1971595 RepID=UPI000C2BA375|nr:aspartate kinase [Vibrio sp. HA2012]PJC85960.1 aspartate kinase [Vibrio sp. HA2012]